MITLINGKKYFLLFIFFRFELFISELQSVTERDHQREILSLAYRYTIR